MMKKWIKNHVPALLFSLSMVVGVLGADMLGGDAQWFRGMIKDADYHYLTFAILRYNSWSSRLLIESITAYFSVHYIQFVVMIFLVSFLLITSIIRLIGLDDEKYQQYRMIVPILALFFFPVNRLFESAGVIATMTNYYVPMCLLAYALLIFKKQTKRYLSIPKLLAFIFASMQEQFALLGFIIFSVAIVCHLRQKLLIKRYRPFLIVSMLGLLSAKLSHGNALRTAKEIKDRFPDFENVSLLRKLDIGFIRMTYDLLFEGQLTLFFILMLLSILIVAIFRKKINQSIGLIVVLAMIILPYWHIWTPVSKMKGLYDNFPKGLHGNILSITGQTVMSIYPDLIMILMLTATLMMILTVLTTYRERLIILTLLVGGTVTKMVMALSPTVAASSIRTFVPMIFCGILITGYFVKLALNEVIDNRKTLL